MNSSSPGYPAAAARNAAPAAAPSYSVCRSTTSGPSSAQYAPVPPYGMPTLPGLTNRRQSASRSNGMWVWPSTTVRSAVPAKASLYRCTGESTSTISVSLRVLAWQNRTAPSPVTSRVADSGRSASRSLCRAASRVAPYSVGRRATSGRPGSSAPSKAAASSRSALPRTQTTWPPSPASRSSVSAGIGPVARSPLSTMASAPAAATSLSTASSAGRFP